MNSTEHEIHIYRKEKEDYNVSVIKPLKALYYNKTLSIGEEEYRIFGLQALLYKNHLHPYFYMTKVDASKVAAENVKIYYFSDGQEFICLPLAELSCIPDTVKLLYIPGASDFND